MFAARMYRDMEMFAGCGRPPPPATSAEGPAGEGPRGTSGERAFDAYFSAFITSRAALRPEAPNTPPPGWVLAPVRYRPGIGVR